MGKFDVFYNKPDYEYSNKFLRFKKQQQETQDRNKRGLFTKGIDILAAPGRAVTGAIHSFTDDDIWTNPITTTYNVLKTANPFTDKSHEKGRYNFSDILSDVGWEKDYNPEGKWYNPLSWDASNVARGVVGFAGDVALDPLTYLSGGGSAIGKVAKAGDKSKYASRLYRENLTRDVAEDIINKSGFSKTVSPDDLIDKITKDAGIRSKETPIKWMGKEIVSSKTVDDIAESLRPITELISNATKPIGAKVSSKFKPLYDKVGAKKFTDLFVNETKREYKRLAKEDPVKAAEFLLGSMKMAKSNKKFYDEMFNFNQAANAMKQELDEVGISQSDLANYMERGDLWKINKDKRTIIDSEIQGMEQVGVKPFRAVWEGGVSKPTKATWKNQDFDQPVTVVGEAGEMGGKKYYNIKGSGSAIPEDELFTSGLKDDVLESGDRLVAEADYVNELMPPDMSSKFRQFYEGRTKAQKANIEALRNKIKGTKDDLVQEATPTNIQRQADYRNIDYPDRVSITENAKDILPKDQVKTRRFKTKKSLEPSDITPLTKKEMSKFIAEELVDSKNISGRNNMYKQLMKEKDTIVKANFNKLKAESYAREITEHFLNASTLSTGDFNVQFAKNLDQLLNTKSKDELFDMVKKIRGIDSRPRFEQPTSISNLTEEAITGGDEFIEKQRSRFIDGLEGTRSSKDKVDYAGGDIAPKISREEIIRAGNKPLPKKEIDKTYDAQVDFENQLKQVLPKEDVNFILKGKPYTKEVDDLSQSKYVENGYDALDDFTKADGIDFDIQNFELVGKPYDVNFTMKDTAKEIKYKRYVDEFYKNTNKVAKEFNIPTIKVNKKMTEDTIDNTNWTIEMDEKLGKELFGDNKKAQELLTKIKNDFYKWGKEEGISDLEALILAYVPHVLEGKNMAGVFKQFSNKQWDISKLKNEFKEGRKYKGTIDEINERTGGMFIDNLSKLYLHRGLRHNQLVFGKHYYNDLVDMFGKRISDVDTFLTNNQNYKNAYMATQDIQKFIVDNVKKEDIPSFLKRNKLPEDIIDNFVPVTEVPFDTLRMFREIDDAIPAFALDDVVIGNINDAGKLIYDENLNTFKNIFDKVTNTFKQNVTVLSPSWYPRNVAGNYFNNFLNVGGVVFDRDIDEISDLIVRYKNRDPNKVSTALSTDVVDTVLKTKDGKEYTVQQIVDMIEDYGVITQGGFKEVAREMGQGVVDAQGRSVAKDPNIYNPLATLFDIGDIKGSITKSPKQMRHEQFGVARAMGDFGSKLEDKAKVQNFLANLKLGKTPFEAVDSTKKYLFDYGELSKFERDYMKRIVPFYTWIRKNTPLQLEELLNQPGLYMGLEHARENIEEYTDDRVPYDQREAWKELGIQLPGGEGMTLNNMLPIGDLGMIPRPTTDFYRDAGGTINPIISSPLEALLNRDMFFGDEVGDAGERLEKIPKSILPTYFRQLQYLDSEKDSDAKLRNLLKDITGVSLTK